MSEGTRGRFTEAEARDDQAKSAWPTTRRLERTEYGPSGHRSAGLPVAAVPAFLVVGVLTLASLIGVVNTSLRRGVLGERGLGLDAWRRLFTDPGFLDSVRFTVWVAVASTVLAMVAAVGSAVALRRSRWAPVTFALPVATPHLVMATVAVLWWAPGGLADRVMSGPPFSVIGNTAGVGIILVYLAKEAPFLTLLALAALDEATQELDDTAAVLGAARWQRLRDVILPRLAIPLLAGGILVAAFTIGAVEVPLVVGPTLPKMIGPYALEAVRITGPVAQADAAVAELAATAMVAGVAFVAWFATRRRGRG